MSPDVDQRYLRDEVVPIDGKVEKSIDEVHRPPGTRALKRNQCFEEAGIDHVKLDRLDPIRGASAKLVTEFPDLLRCIEVNPKLRLGAFPNGALELRLVGAPDFEPEKKLPGDIFVPYRGISRLKEPASEFLARPIGMEESDDTGVQIVQRLMGMAGNLQSDLLVDPPLGHRELDRKTIERLNKTHFSDSTAK